MQSGHETPMKPSRARISNFSIAVKLWPRIIISRMCAVKPAALGPNQCKPIGNNKNSCKAAMQPSWFLQCQNIEFQHCRQTLIAHMITFCIIISKTCAVKPLHLGPKQWISAVPSNSDRAHDQCSHHNFKDVRGQAITYSQNNEFQQRLQIQTALLIPFCIIISKMRAVKPSHLGP